MRKMTKTTFGLVLATCSSPHVADARLLKCQIEDAREVVDGTLEQSAISKISLDRDLLFDDVEAVLTMPGGMRWNFEVIQQPSSENGLIAVRNYQGPSSLSHMSFQLSTWQDDLPFLFVFGAEVQSGRCKPF